VRIGDREVAARLSRRSAESLDWELDLIARAESAGVQSARLIPARDGRRHVNAIVAFEWIVGDAPASRREWSAVRDALSRLHEATRHWPQRPGFASTSELLTLGGGGDVDLASMPLVVVEQCRAAWRSVADEPTSAIHGDPVSNVLIVDGMPTFFDWDESRVDMSMLDFDVPLVGSLTPEQRRAAVAWEVACSWMLEPEYARRRLRELQS
jgi:Ser/Thr protein kinase RdoA (MazF antagonist)